MLYRVIIPLIAVLIAFSSITSPVPYATAAFPEHNTDPILITFSAGSGVRDVSIRPSVPDREGAGPSAIAMQGEDDFYILDSGNDRILHYDRVAQTIDTISLPSGIGAGDLVVAPDGFFVLDVPNSIVLGLDTAGNVTSRYPLPDTPGALSSQIVLAPSGQPRLRLLNRTDIDLLEERIINGAVNDSPRDPLAAPLLRPAIDNLTAQPGLSVAGLPGVYTSTQRVSSQQGHIFLTDPLTGTQQTLTIRVNHFLGSSTLLTVDHLGNAYVLVEELLDQVPVILAETSVWRFGADGAFTGMARLPLEASPLLPNRFVAVSPAGSVYFLQVDDQSAAVIEVPFTTRYSSDGLEARWAQWSQQHPVSQLEASLDTPARADRAVSRSQIIQNAQAYMSVNWTLGAANYHNGPTGDTDWSPCATSEHWKLPRYLSNRLNQVIAETPYEYGGKVSISTFRSRIASGAWAGNICMEGGDIASATGIDCSGLVQNAWQLAYNQQWLPSYSHVINWSELLAGDMLRTDGHTILFESFVNGSDISGGAWLYEATMTNRVDRVVHWTRTYSAISGYTPYRFNDAIGDQPTIPPYQNVILNSGFDGDSFANWWQWGDIDRAFYGNGVLYFKRRATTNGGNVGQNVTAYRVPAGWPLEMRLKLGNTSGVTKTPGVFIRYNDYWDIGCHFEIPPNTPLQEYIVRGLPSVDWAGFNIEVWPDPPDGIPDMMMDGVTVQYRPDLSLSGTQCIPPSTDTTNPGGEVTTPVNGSIIHPGQVTFVANAWDNAGGSGVERVRFYVHYNGAWQPVGEVTTPPYQVTWTAPAGLQDQQMSFTVHVVDKAGNVVMDPGGYRNVWYYSCTTCGPAASSWAQHRGNAAHFGRSSHVVSKSPGKIWQVNDDGVATGLVLDPQGNLYVGMHNSLVSLTPGGSIRWSYDGTKEFVVAPAVSAHGQVYAGSADFKVYAFTTAGKLLWSYTLGDIASSAPTIGADGTVYIGSFDGYLYALTPGGKLKWRYQVGSWVQTAPAIDANGDLYIGSANHNIYGIRADGTLKWNYTTQGYVDGAGALSNDFSTLYMASTDHYLYALNTANGQVRWKYDAGTTMSWSYPAVGADGVIYVGTADDLPGHPTAALHAINPNGTKRWSHAFTENVNGSPTIDRDGMILITVDDGYIYVLKPDGTVRASYHPDPYPYGRWLRWNPVIRPDGGFYLVSFWPASVYAYAPLPHHTYLPSLKK